MEFLEFFKSVQEVVPQEQQRAIALLNQILPFLTLGIGVLACFLGYKLHKAWLVLTFFTGAFFIAGIAQGMLLPNAAPTWMIVSGAAAGVLTGVLSLKLHHFGMVVLTFIMAFNATLNFLALFMQRWVCVLLGIAAGIIAAVIVGKYKFISIMVVTAASGAFSGVQTVFHMLGKDDLALEIILMLFFTAAGMACQFYLEKEHLKKAAHELRHPQEALHRTSSNQTEKAADTAEHK